jgi:hypothetical protein
MPGKDPLIWHGSSNGEFSVRNAYLMEKDLQTIRYSESSRKGDGNLIWKSLLWNLKIPNASKMLMWRAYNDLLPR